MDFADAQFPPQLPRRSNRDTHQISPVYRHPRTLWRRLITPLLRPSSQPEIPEGEGLQGGGLTGVVRAHEHDRVAELDLGLGKTLEIADGELGEHYPRSLVGVPGERFSNMGPPTLAVVALTFLQVGLVLVIRPKVLAWLERGELPQRALGWINEHAMPLYLFHSTGMAAVVAVLFGFGYVPPAEPTLEWWLIRPLWLIGPAIATWPLLALYRLTKRPPATAVPKTAE